MAKTVGKAVILGIFLVARSATWAQTEKIELGYANLAPEQRRLVDDWFGRFSTVVKKPVKPSEAYDKLPISTQTTFSAVTHALMKTALVTVSGERLGPSALAIIDKVDTVAGQILGAGGDKQFRLYVQAHPQTIDWLTRSTAFRRSADNTVYHRGYPICFRGKSGTPSIQVSLSRDGSRADIDVDYRSSRFPVSLVNGHLTASNSDVRAGDNDNRHNRQWSGLTNWWRNLLGLPLEFDSKPHVGGSLVSARPAKKLAKPEEAARDFLNDWLVKRKPEEAVGYIDSQAYACLGGGDRPVDRGMARFTLLKQMMEANKSLGPARSLGDIASAVEVPSERLRAVDHPYATEFALYDVREDLAEQFNCANRFDSAPVSRKAMNSTAFGKYVGVVFRVKIARSPVVATLWKRENGYWKMISFEVDPEVDRSSAPDVGNAVGADGPLESVEGDPALLTASETFLTQWLVAKNIDRALTSVAPAFLACVNHYRPEGRPIAKTAAAQRAILRRGMADLAAGVGPVASLAEAIVPSTAHHPDLKLVQGANPAFLLVSLPDAMGDSADCLKRPADGQPDLRPASGPTTYGKYFAAGFSLRQGTAAPDTLWVVWSRVNGNWKAVSYIMMAP